MWTPTVLYQLSMMTRNYARFEEMRESQRPVLGGGESSHVLLGNVG